MDIMKVGWKERGKENRNDLNGGKGERKREKGEREE